MDINFTSAIIGSGITLIGGTIITLVGWALKKKFDNPTKIQSDTDKLNVVYTPLYILLKSKRSITNSEVHDELTNIANTNRNLIPAFLLEWLENPYSNMSTFELPSNSKIHLHIQTYYNWLSKKLQREYIKNEIIPMYLPYGEQVQFLIKLAYEAVLYMPCIIYIILYFSVDASLEKNQMLLITSSFLIATILSRFLTRLYKKWDVD